jgi:DNA-binding CsgD family transcriptional regulator
MSDEIGAGARGYINRVALYVCAVCAAHDGEPDALASARTGAEELLSWSDCRASQSLGTWMVALLNAAEGNQDTAGKLDAAQIDPLARGSLLASEPRSHPDGPRLVRFLLLNGQKDDAVGVTGRLQALLGRSPDFPSLAGAARHAQALVDEDFVGVRQALELYGQETRPLVKAAVLEDMGRLAPTADGVQHLDQALEIYSQSGAKLDAGRVRRLLRERGVRRGGPGSRSPSSWPELTKSELAVVQLVARGATNLEVAEKLFLSPHTVNAHLRHVYVKLRIRSRVELARIAADRQADQRDALRRDTPAAEHRAT